MSAENRHYRLRVVVRRETLVEAIEQSYLLQGGPVDIAQELVLEESFRHRFITLQELRYHRLRIEVGGVLCLYEQLPAFAVGLHVYRAFAAVVVQTNLLHWLGAEYLVGKQIAVPCKLCGGLQTKLRHRIAVGISGVLAAAAHLLLCRFEEVQYGRLGIELSVDRECLDKHAYRVSVLFVATVMNGGEKCLRFVVILGDEVPVNGREERALVDALLLAESLRTRHIKRHLPRLFAFLWLVLLQVRQYRSERLAAIEISGVPRFIGCFLLLARLRFRYCGLRQFHLSAIRHRLSASCIRLLDIGKQHLAGGTVIDNMVDILQDIEMLLVMQQSDTEQTVFE